MDSSNEQMELEEGEINDLEDGEIEDDETTEEKTVKTVSNQAPSLIEKSGSDFPRAVPPLRGNKSPLLNSNLPQVQKRRDNGLPLRYKNNESWSRERENPARAHHVKPTFHFQEFANGARPTNLPRSRGKQRPLLPTPPRPIPQTPPRPLPQIPPRSVPQIPPRPLPPLLQPSPRSKPFFFHDSRLQPPLPEETPTLDTNDFDLLLERHKQIQSQLEDLEREESAITNDDLIDDSFIDIPVDGDDNDEKNDNVDQETSGEGTSGILTNESKEEKTVPKNFSPFKIKPLHPPIPSIKELSEKQKQKEEIPSEISKPNNTQVVKSSPVAANKRTNQRTKAAISNKRKRRRGRKKRQRENLKSAAALSKANETRTKIETVHVQPTSEIESRLMELASSSSGPSDMSIKMRNNTEQQKKRREKLRQWQQSRSDSLAGKGRKSPSTTVRSGSESKDFEKDDYLEAPMDVESDTPDGPVLPLIEETGEDPPPPPPPPLATREQELMTLMQQQQQQSFRNYPDHTLVNQVHVSPNIHGFYPPGQIMYGEWASAYPITSSTADQDFAPSQEQKPEVSENQNAAGSEEEDDDEADLLREILLKSVAKKRAAKPTDKKTLDSSPASPQPPTRSTKTLKPAVKKKDAGPIHKAKKPSQSQSITRMVSIQPPQHDPVVIQLGQDSDDDSDYFDKEERQPELRERGGFFGSLDMMIKQARQSAVENSKPKPQVSKEEPSKLTVPKTPDALAHLPEERRAEYRRLKEQLALHEGRKRQPLSDISQDKESKSESDVGEEKMDTLQESSEVLELKQKVKTFEEKLTKTRKLLSEDQGRLSKMTSILSEKTTLLEEQEIKVAKIKKQLEANQRAMLSNRVMIKKLHEKAMLVKDRVSKRQTLSRNTEEELLRMKSLMSAMRKNPGFCTLSSNENKASNNQASSPAPKTQELKANEGKQGTGVTFKRSMDDSVIVTTKRAKLEPPRSQSLKASPRKQAITEIIAQEKARLKALEQELAHKLSQYSKSSAASTQGRTLSNTRSESNNKKSELNVVDKDHAARSDGKSGDRLEGSSEVEQEPGESTKGDDSHVVKNAVFKIDVQQLDYVKTLQAEKEKKGAVFPSVTSEIPQPIHKSVAKCIWLESKPEVTPVIDVQTSNLDWLSSTNRPNEKKKVEDEMETDGNVAVGLYESILLYFKSYRLSPYFRTKAGISLRSLSHTNKLNPTIPLCKYDLKGTCNDEGCQYQHKRDYTPNEDDTLRDFAAYSFSDKDAFIIDIAEERIKSLVDKFSKQYKDKISMDQLYVLLVNHVRLESKTFLPYHIRGNNHSLLLRQQKKLVVVEESGTVDKGRGVHYVKREEQRKTKYAKQQECQEVRYFSEAYNSLKTLLEAVEDCPSNVALWIKLARLQLCQKSEHIQESQDEEDSDIGIVQSLNTLSRGLEANPTSEDLWLEYLKLFYAQGNPEEHKELCEQAIGFTPSYNIWWHYLESMDNYHDKRTVCIRLINHLAEQDTVTDLHSHHILESLLYLIQLELYTGRYKTALSTFMVAIAKKTSTSKEEIPKLCTRLSPQDLSLVWLSYIHVFEFSRLPMSWFEQKYGTPSRMVAKDHFVFPWQPSGGTKAPSEKLLALFHEALRSCTYKDKTMSKVSLCLPLYQNLLALERAHGRVDSAKGICRRLLQSTPSLVQLWQCLQALEESTGNPSQALAVLDEGLKKCGNDCELAYTMACLHLEQGHASYAVQVLVNNVKSKYLKAPPNKGNSQDSASSTDVDPIMLYRKLLHQPLPYDSQPVQLVDDTKPCGKDELYLWLSYCLLLQLAPNISPLCLQYNLSAVSAYETAVHSILNTKHTQTVWLEYLFYKKSKLVAQTSTQPSGQSSLKSLDDLINRCLVSVSSSRSLPFSTSESWQDYSFHNQVIRLYLGCLPQSLWSAVYTKYLKAYPGNLQLAIRACEHEVNVGCIDQAVKIAAVFLTENPLCITIWKIMISLNLQRKHTKEAHKLYQQSTEMLPFAATLWKDYIMFEMVNSDGKSSIEDIIKVCDKVGVDVQEYLNTLLGK